MKWHITILIHCKNIKFLVLILYHDCMSCRHGMKLGEGYTGLLQSLHTLLISCRDSPSPTTQVLGGLQESSRGKCFQRLSTDGGTLLGSSEGFKQEFKSLWPHLWFPN